MLTSLGGYKEVLMSADKVGGSKKGQKHVDVILEWFPTYLQIHWGYTLFRPTTSVLVYCYWLIQSVYSSTKFDWIGLQFWGMIQKMLLYLNVGFNEKYILKTNQEYAIWFISFFKSPFIFQSNRFIRNSILPRVIKFQKLFHFFLSSMKIYQTLRVFLEK